MKVSIRPGSMVTSTAIEMGFSMDGKIGIGACRLNLKLTTINTRIAATTNTWEVVTNTKRGTERVIRLVTMTPTTVVREDLAKFTVPKLADMVMTLSLKPALEAIPTSPMILDTATGSKPGRGIYRNMTSLTLPITIAIETEITITAVVSATKSFTNDLTVKDSCADIKTVTVAGGRKRS